MSTVYYAENEIDQIVASHDLLTWIGKYINVNKVGSFYFAKCPFHNDFADSMIISPEEGMFFCPACGEGGNIINFIMKYENKSFYEVMQMLRQEPNEENRDSTQKKKESRICEINKIAVDSYSDNLTLSKVATEYVHKRKIEDDMREKFKIGYSYEKGTNLYRILLQKGFKKEELIASKIVFSDKEYIADRFYDRLMFPIQDINGRYIGFGGRILSEKSSGKGIKTAKYINSPDSDVFDKSINLYGMNFAKTSEKDFFILCEGYMDVISMHQAGFTNAVASLGTALTEGQARLLKNFKDKVYISYDSDPAGIKAAIRAIPLLISHKIDVRFIQLDPYKDPDEIIKKKGKEELAKRVENSLLLSEWAMKTLYITKNYKDLLSYI